MKSFRRLSTVATLVVLQAIAFSSLTRIAAAQPPPFAGISAEANYRNPASDYEGFVFPTGNDWAAAGFQKSVSARSLGNNEDSLENIAKSSASFNQQPNGVGTARGYAFTGAKDSRFPVDVSSRTQIFSNFTMRVEGKFDPERPWFLKAFLPVHGTFSAFDFTHEVGSAVATAYTNVRVRTSGGGFQPFYDVARGGSVTVRSKDYDYNPDEPAFEVEATDDFVGAVTMRNDLNDPEGYNWTSHAAELSQIIVYDLPLNVNGVTNEISQDVYITFLQEISSSLTNANYKFAYADLRNTTGFGIYAVDPTTGQTLDGVIRVTTLGISAPEPGALALFFPVALVLSGIAGHRRHRNAGNRYGQSA